MATKHKQSSPDAQASGAARSSPTGAGTTSSGPSHPGSPKTPMAAHAADQQALAAAMPTNEAKAAEYGLEAALAPVEGATTSMPSPTAGAGTLSEKISRKRLASLPWNLKHRTVR